MEYPLISIIVAAYNIEPYISSCIDSLINQTYQNIEMIIVNDGSTDGTGEIIDFYAKKDRRVETIHKKNTGVSDTRNKGIEAAAGEYIAFVDGDDIVDKHMYEFLYHNLVKYDADISHCGYRIVRDNYEDILIHGTGEVRTQNRNQGIIDLLEGDLVEPSIWNKLYKRNILEQVKFDSNIAMLEDLLFNINVFDNSHKSIFIDKPMYSYTQRIGSACHTKINSKTINDPITVFELICNKYQNDSTVFDYAKARLINAYINCYKGMITTDYEERGKYKELATHKLKENKFELKSNPVLSMKAKLMSLMILYAPRIFELIFKCYSKKTQNRNKYKV
jgi:glycosyltransferase involved in cell wall biosynthesis